MKELNLKKMICVDFMNFLLLILLLDGTKCKQ